MRLAIVLLLTCGCRQIFGIDEPRLLDSALPSGDAAMPSDADLADAAPLCFSRTDLDFGACLAHAPMVGFTVTSPVSIDTDASPYCETLISPTQDMCVVTATDVAVAAGVTATGARPLVIFALGTIEIDAIFDVAGHAANSGPGENPTVCGTTAAGATLGGGAGGSFTTRGGDGGRGGAGGSTPGLAASPFIATSLHGGCRGGLGAGGTSATAFGGGALALIASSVVIGNNGAIDASGAAGAGGAMGGRGGYGGGTGGMVLIDAPTVTFSGTGQIYAIGGAGGGGSSVTSTGTIGAEASSYNATVAGGQGGNSSGDGGISYPSTQPGGMGGGGSAGGGGGGGGEGAVIIYTSSDFGGVTLHVTPPPSLRAY